jgi:hypothetical protein
VILLSSHLLNQVQSVCDRIGIFASGRLIGQGTLEQLAHRFGDGKSQLEVGFDTSDAEAQARGRELLRAVPGVVAVEPLADGGHSLATGARPWVLSMDRGTDPAVVRRAVLAVVAEHSLPLSSIRPIVPSLEDIYRRAVAEPLPARTPATPAEPTRPSAGAAAPAGRPRPVMRGRPRPGRGAPVSPGVPADAPPAAPAPGSVEPVDDTPEPVVIKEERS